jgi:hypothetical protein
VLIKEIPFLRIVVPLSLGILSGVYFHPGGILLTLFPVAALTGLSVSLLFNKYLVNIVYGSSLSVFLFFAGHILYRTEKEKLSSLDQVRREYICTVSDYPELRGNSLRVTARLKWIAAYLLQKGSPGNGFHARRFTETEMHSVEN